MGRRKGVSRSEKEKWMRELLTLRIVWAVASVFLCEDSLDSFDLNSAFSLKWIGHRSEKLSCPIQIYSEILSGTQQCSHQRFFFSLIIPWSGWIDWSYVDHVVSSKHRTKAPGMLQQTGGENQPAGPWRLKDPVTSAFLNVDIFGFFF